MEKVLEVFVRFVDFWIVEFAWDSWNFRQLPNTSPSHSDRISTENSLKKNEQ
jgi:hypothetical protein